jgi:hypothetical protein
MGEKEVKPGMNYIQLLNLFWLADKVCQFSGNETKLYLGLLDLCNKLNWKNPFGESERFLSDHLDISVNTIRHSRNRLIESGLIKVTMPEKGSKAKYGVAYYFLTAAKIEAVEEVEPLQKLNQTAAEIEAQPLQKLNQTAAEIEAIIRPSLKPSLKPSFYKQEKNDFDLIIPQSIVDHKYYSQFLESWNRLIQSSKWKGKNNQQLQETLNSFSNYNPGYLIDAISNVIQAGWPAVMLDKKKHVEWLNEHGMSSENWGNNIPINRFIGEDVEDLDKTCPTKPLQIHST